MLGISATVADANQGVRGRQGPGRRRLAGERAQKLGPFRTKRKPSRLELTLLPGPVAQAPERTRQL